MALTFNYHLDPDAIGLLGLVTTQTLPAILHAVIDGDRILDFIRTELEGAPDPKAEPASSGPPTDSGATADCRDTSPPSQTSS
jgi:hypothetical protein